MSFLRLLGVAGCSALAALSAAAAGAGTFDERASVTRIVDGDTVDVRLSNGRRERVRVLGIDTPERGACGATEATAATSRLALGRRVTLVGDATQASRDRYGRLLAYVWLPGGKDLGFQLVAGGHARVYVFDRPFKRLSAYRNAEAVGKGKGMWKCGSRPNAVAAVGACMAGYSPCLPVVADLDCGVISSALKPIRVTGGDPYRLDGDGDGFGCE